MFQDRTDAGKRLALALSRFKDQNALVLAIPRGGVEVGYQVAHYLNADFSILVARKLPYPDNPEAGFGAIAEDGSIFIFPYIVRTLSTKMIDKVVYEQEKELERRVRVLRDDQPLPDIRQRTIILIDDGIAMGSTMRVAIMLCRKKGAGKIIIASPVASPDTASDMTEICDETAILETPRFFRAVAHSYTNWYDVPDEEVVGLMKKWQIEAAQHPHEVG